MSEIASINGSSAVSVALPGRAALALAPAESASASDQVELSAVGQILGRLSPNPPIRAEKVAQIRQAIDAGTYMSPDKIDTAVDRLLDVLKLR